jgi:hypothetical protein
MDHNVETKQLEKLVWNRNEYHIFTYGINGQTYLEEGIEKAPLFNMNCKKNFLSITYSIFFKITLNYLKYK